MKLKHWIIVGVVAIICAGAAGIGIVIHQDDKSEQMYRQMQEEQQKFVETNRRINETLRGD